MLARLIDEHQVTASLVRYRYLAELVKDQISDHLPRIDNHEWRLCDPLGSSHLVSADDVSVFEYIDANNALLWGVSAPQGENPTLESIARDLDRQEPVMQYLVWDAESGYFYIFASSADDSKCMSPDLHFPTFQDLRQMICG